LIETKQITIKAGETVTVHHKFQNLPESAINIERKKNIAWITILAYPYAIIEIDGKTYGEFHQLFLILNSVQGLT